MAKAPQSSSLTSDEVRQLCNDPERGVYVTDARRKIVLWNSMAEKLTGHKAEEVVGKGCGDGVRCHLSGEGCWLCGFRCPVGPTMKDGKVREARVYLRHADGHRVPVEIGVMPLCDPSGNVIGAVEIFTDASLVKEVEGALVDEESGLGTRVVLKRQMGRLVEESPKAMPVVGLAVLDMDQLLDVAKSGDEARRGLLRAVGESLLKVVGPSCLAVRWDETRVALLASGESVESLKANAARWRATLRTSSFDTGKAVVRTTLSVGVATSRRDESPELVLRRALLNLESAVRSGRDCLVTDS
jgi:GGDEF domain-containing protein